MLGSFCTCIILFSVRNKKFIAWEKRKEQAKKNQRLHRNPLLNTFNGADLFFVALAVPGFAFHGIIV
jgi:hypothetical protein